MDDLAFLQHALPLQSTNIARHRLPDGRSVWLKKANAPHPMWRYRALGAEGEALEAALAYSNVIFGGIVLMWLMNAFASVIRGTGNMLVPSLVIIA